MEVEELAPSPLWEHVQPKTVPHVVPEGVVERPQTKEQLVKVAPYEQRQVSRGQRPLELVEGREQQ